MEIHYKIFDMFESGPICEVVNGESKSIALSRPMGTISQLIVPRLKIHNLMNLSFENSAPFTYLIFN